MTWEYSCGGVVFTHVDGELRFVLAQDRKRQYGFPKGHMERGETQEQTALREIREEVGLDVRLLPGFREISIYPLPGKPNTSKRVTFFLAEYENQQIVPQSAELMNAPLVSYERALKLLSHEANRRILRKAMEFLQSAQPGSL